MTDQVTISERDGLRYLHLGSPWVQGVMRLEKPDQLELTYIQQMMMWALFQDHPTHIVQLGLGAASLTRFCHQHYSSAHVTAVELNAEVIHTCRLLFDLPEDGPNLTVLQRCAYRYVEEAPDHSIDVLQVDLYSADAQEPACEGEDFYANCARSLRDDGILTVNILGNASVHGRHIQQLQDTFAAVAWLPESHDGNLIAIAFKNAPQIEFEQLYQKAAILEARLGLPAGDWVDDLVDWMQGD
ncbi:spermidine synthase [Paenalcaligenes sp. Me131]|uniref:spermine/spermidine synthase domain-containing protein n=1 Tax=Paenalcaligenes sp. Me131 TaxID=3392636 RepID=UPI003D2CFD2D